MAFKIPFTFLGIEMLKRRTVRFQNLAGHKKDSLLQRYIDKCNVEITREEYWGIVISTTVNFFPFILVLSSVIMFVSGVQSFILYSVGISVIISGFIAMSQLLYPKVFSSRRERDIEKNLIAALQDMLVQLNAGVPLFSILVNISISDYGELSNEFKTAVKRINAGIPQIDVLEEIGEKNPSIYLKRALWQVSNGMRAGSDITIVIQDSIKALNEEQLIQIQNYGNKLNPLIMFYMLITVIIPALSITFLTIIASMVNLPVSITKLMFVGLYVFVTLIQVMFLGIIKSVRPSLL